MILTVTMNPAIDKTVTIPTLVRGGLNRIQTIETDIGGKGINVSKTIRALGGQSVALGFAGGRNGAFIEKTLRGMGICTAFLPVDGETRCNTKIVEESGAVTELNEPGPEIGEAAVEAFLQMLETYPERAEEKTILVLSGSLPKGVEPDIYAKIIKTAHTKGSKVLLDADGEAFRAAIEAVPDMIKPNRAELEAYYGVQNATLEELCKMGEKLIQKGIEKVVISLGSEGALFLEKEKALYGKGMHVDVHSTVGAGDAMAAALVYAAEHDLPMEQYAALAMAVSAGAVMTTGTKPPERAVVDTLLTKVELTSSMSSRRLM